MAEAEGAGRTIPDGDYWVCSAIAQSYFLDVPGNEPITSNGANVRMWIWNSSMPTQYDVFHFEYLNNGFYKITLLNSNMALDVDANSLDMGTNVQLWSANGSNAQQWSVEDSGTGYRLRVRCSAYYLDVYGGNYANDTNIRAWDGNGSKAQGFSLIPYEPNERPIADGDYTIWSNLKDGVFLDAIGISSEYANSTNVDIWNSADTVNRADAEQFVVKYESDGWYRIYEKTSGLAFEVANAPDTFTNKNQNAMLYEKNSSRGQLWKIRQNSDGTYFLINKLNGQYLDVWNGLTDNGINVQSHPYNGSNAQRWRFVAIRNYVYYVLGDVDGDGEVAITDATLIQRKLADMSVPNFNETAADINGGGLDIIDATLIQRYLAEMSVSYLIGHQLKQLK